MLKHTEACPKVKGWPYSGNYGCNLRSNRCDCTPEEPKASTCRCGYTAKGCKDICDSQNSHCGCSGVREHDDECDCQLCLKMGMEYLRDKVYQLELVIKQLRGFDLDGEG